jgi:hypothetical protein
LEILNNIIQYQFDGNFNLVYTVIRKRNLFFNLLNLPTDQSTIDGLTSKKSATTAPTTTPTTAAATPNKSDRMKNDLPRSSTELRSMEGAIAAKEAEPGTLKVSLAETPSILKMTEKSVSAINASLSQEMKVNESSNGSENLISENFDYFSEVKPSTSINGQIELNKSESSDSSTPPPLTETQHVPTKATSLVDTSSSSEQLTTSKSVKSNNSWKVTAEWISSWKAKLPLQTIMRLLQVLVPQVEKICLDKGLTDESEILKFLQNGTLVGLLPVPHPILIRKYQPNLGTIMWFRTYMWGVIYLRNLDPPIWYDTDVKLFEIQRV